MKDVKSSIMKKNIIYCYLEIILKTQHFLGRMLVILYLQYLNITLSQYLYIDAILVICVAIFEIPSGFIADILGRKKTLIMSLIINIISMIILLTIKNFYGGVISVIVLSLGSSLGSGDSEAILYKIFSKYGELELYNHILSKRMSLFYIITVITSVVAGFIFGYSMAWVVILDIIVLCLYLFFTSIFLVDEKNYNLKKIELININIRTLNLKSNL